MNTKSTFSICMYRSSHTHTYIYIIIYIYYIYIHIYAYILYIDSRDRSRCSQAAATEFFAHQAKQRSGPSLRLRGQLLGLLDHRRVVSQSNLQNEFLMDFCYFYCCYGITTIYIEHLEIDHNYHNIMGQLLSYHTLQ